MPSIFSTLLHKHTHTHQKERNIKIIIKKRPRNVLSISWKRRRFFNKNVFVSIWYAFWEWVRTWLNENKPQTDFTGVDSLDDLIHIQPESSTHHRNLQSQDDCMDLRFDEHFTTKTTQFFKRLCYMLKKWLLNRRTSSLRISFFLLILSQSLCLCVVILLSACAEPRARHSIRRIG